MNYILRICAVSSLLIVSIETLSDGDSLPERPKLKENEMYDAYKDVENLKLPAYVPPKQTEFDPLPIKKVAPIYDRVALRNKIEGYCTVKYTVTIKGDVVRPEIVDAEPRGYFEEECLEASLKFKYKPGISNGKPVETPGIINTFKFFLE